MGRTGKCVSREILTDRTGITALEIDRLGHGPNPQTHNLRCLSSEEECRVFMGHQVFN